MSKIKLIFYLLVLAFIFSMLYIIFDLELLQWGFTLKFNSIETISSRSKEVFAILMAILSFIKRFFVAIFDFLAPLFKELTTPR